jgi:DNA-binding response OmpR family regulator
MKILIVDDTPADLTLLTEIVTLHGYTVVGASSVAKAERILHEDPGIGLILLDLMMPKEDGFAFLHFWRRHAIINTIPVIICSAAGDSESVIQANKAGAIDFLVKPVTTEVVITKIQSVLSRIQTRGCVLVADSEQVLGSLIGEIVRRAGYRCLSVTTGKEIIAILENETIDLIITESQLSDMGGKQLVAEIHKQSPSVPVIFTGTTQKVSLSGARIQGAVDIIFKPTTNLDILSKLAKYLSKESSAKKQTPVV